MPRRSAKTVTLLVVVVATLVAALVLFLHVGGTSNPPPGRPLAKANSGRVQGPPGSSNSSLEFGNDSRGGNDAVTTPTNSDPKQNSPVDGGEPEHTGDPIWSPIERLPDLSHLLYVHPRWTEDSPAITPPADYLGDGYNFAESATWRYGKRHTYDPRTTYDAAVHIKLRFLSDASETGLNKEPIDWVEVRSSLTGEGWKFSPRKKDGSGCHSVSIMVPLAKRDILIVRARRMDGVSGEGLVTEFGLGPGNTYARRTLNDDGLVDLSLFPLDSLESFSGCALAVTDANGNPIEDALVLYGSQVLGRTDHAGAATLKVPEGPYVSTTNAGNHHLVVWRAGYVPIFLSRDDLQKQSWSVSVRLAAKELLVNLPAQIDSAWLFRGEISSIVTAGNDLIPLPEDFSGVTWEGTVGPWLVGTDGNGVKGAWVEQGLAFGGSQSGADGIHGYARGLEETLGTKSSESWPYTYGSWYHNRWSYVDGTLAASLPYAGKFMLLLGEGTTTLVDTSTLTHVLFIDARDPDKPIGKLLKRPGY